MAHRLTVTGPDLSPARSGDPVEGDSASGGGQAPTKPPIRPDARPTPPDGTAPAAPSPTDRQAEMAMRGAMLRSAPVLIIPRPIPGGVAARLDTVPVDDLPRFVVQGALSALRQVVKRGVLERLTDPRWLANWLVDDIVDKAEMMAHLTGAPELRVRLDVIDDDHCRKFHVDNVRLRLVTTYRGPGTEWISPRLAGALPPGSLPPHDAIRHLSRGHVAVMRGGKDATPGRPGVLHRSPAIAGTGIVRLFLAIDEVGRRLH